MLKWRKTTHSSLTSVGFDALLLVGSF